ncbi:hypothetical protein GWI33_018652 [Rhynchophorus ferrugineus]|uniref:Uncharacterized protein n=1 Tax=Rhynchophorus ferrugineus TaxID=354439 RepID=A0A834HTB2_RHYFE|nr:hypothetical protein GWI33_018652 [Rhynchophorus ferrugineus]
MFIELVWITPGSNRLVQQLSKSSTHGRLYYAVVVIFTSRSPLIKAISMSGPMADCGGHKQYSHAFLYDLLSRLSTKIDRFELRHVDLLTILLVSRPPRSTLHYDNRGRTATFYIGECFS